MQLQRCSVLASGKVSLSVQIQQEGMRVLAVEVRESQVRSALHSELPAAQATSQTLSLAWHDFWSPAGPLTGPFTGLTTGQPATGQSSRDAISADVLLALQPSGFDVQSMLLFSLIRYLLSRWRF